MPEPPEPKAKYIVTMPLPEGHRFREWRWLEEASNTMVLTLKWTQNNSDPPSYLLEWRIPDGTVLPIPVSLRVCGFVGIDGIGGGRCYTPKELPDGEEFVREQARGLLAQDITGRIQDRIRGAGIEGLEDAQVRVEMLEFTA